VLRVKDVGRTELGTQAYGTKALYNGKPAAILAIRQAAGANALATADAIKKKMEELSDLPRSVRIIYPYDTTPFVRVAMEEVVKTLFEAIISFSWSCICSWATCARR
jgi:HAE1 family hydrophobic/amphiphilic exporter-1